MKRYVEKLLRNYAMVVIIVVVCVNGLIGEAETFPISILLELLVILFFAELVELLMNKFISDFRYPILKHLLYFTMGTIGILIGWWIFRWYETTPVWFVITIVAVVYAIECFLDFRKANHDIAYINEQLKQRRDKEKEHTK